MATIDEVIGNFLIERNLSSVDSKARAYNFAVRGLREMLITLGGNVKTKKLQILSNKTAQLPEDYLNYTRVGIVNNRGELATFTRNDQLTYNEVCCEDRLSQPRLDTIPEGIWYDGYALGNYVSYYNSGYWTQQFGIGSGNTIGDFRIDTEANLILFGFHTRHLDHVILEYVCFPTAENGQYVVPPLMTEALQYYIAWKWIMGNLNVPLSERREAERVYRNEKRLANSRIDPLTIQDLNDTIRKSWKLAPKA